MANKTAAMSLKEEIEKRFGRRPSPLTHAQHQDKIRKLKLMLNAAIRACNHDEIWDARAEGFRSGRDAPNSID